MTATRETYGRFVAVEEIDRNVLGPVYDGRDPRSHLRGTIQVIERAARSRGFLERTRRAATADHPNVATVLDYGLEGGDFYQVYEHLAGESLARLLRRREPLAPADRLDLLVQIAEALRVAHTHALLHLCLRPELVWMLGDKIKVIGFGLDPKPGDATLAGEVKDLAYATPEQLRGLEVDSRTDVFAFGVLAHELLTSKPPFRGDSSSALAHQILYSTPEPMAATKHGLSRELAVLLDGCLIKDRISAASPSTS